MVRRSLTVVLSVIAIFNAGIHIDSRLENIRGATIGTIGTF
jgi:hypothetical protein